VKQRDRARGVFNADRQEINSTGCGVTVKIRRPNILDKSLSIYTYNINLVSRDGTKTNEGKVHSQDEIKMIIGKAQS